MISRLCRQHIGDIPQNGVGREQISVRRVSLCKRRSSEGLCVNAVYRRLRTIARGTSIVADHHALAVVLTSDLGRIEMILGVARQQHIQTQPRCVLWPLTQSHPIRASQTKGVNELHSHHTAVRDAPAATPQAELISRTAIRVLSCAEYRLRRRPPIAVAVFSCASRKISASIPPCAYFSNSLF